jgi:two-component system response regulator DegU
MFKQTSDLEVVAEAEDGFAAIDMVERHKPDAVLMDLNMPNLNGIEATRIITSRYPCTKVIVLTMHTDPEYAKEATRAGACSFLPKGCGRDEIVSAIKSCLQEQPSVSCPAPA